MSKGVRELPRDVQRVESGLGKLKKKPSRISPLPAILALQTLFGIVELLGALDLEYYPTIHRLTMTRTFNLGFSLTPIVLLFSIAASAFLIKSKRYLLVLLSATVSALLVFFFGLEKSVVTFSVLITVISLISFSILYNYVFWLLASMTSFETLSLSHWVVFKPLGLPSPTMWVADLELALFFLFGQLAPFAALPTLYLWVTQPTVKMIARFRTKVKGHSDDGSSNCEEGLTIRVSNSVLLACAIVLAVVSAVYPYIPSINPKGSAVGADAPTYVRILEQVWEAPHEIFTISKDRPLSLLAVYGFGRALGLDIGDSVKYFPFILIPLLVVSVYFMVLKATDNECLAAISSLFTSLSFSVTVGMYSYFLADMLGLVLTFTALGFLLGSLRKGSFLALSLACLLGSLVVFTHPWTFIQYYAGVALTLPFLAFECLKKKKIERTLLFTFIYLASTGIVDLLKGSFLGIGGYSAASSMAARMVDISDFWDSNVFCFRYLYGGLLSNTVLLGVAATGAYLLDHRDRFQLFLILLSTASSVLYPFANSTMQSRLLYNVPFGVLASFAVFELLKTDRIPRRIKTAVLLLLTTYMLVYLFRSLANLVSVHPPSRG